MNIRALIFGLLLFPGTANTVTVTNYNSTGTATAWTASDILTLICAAH